MPAGVHELLVTPSGAEGGDGARARPDDPEAFQCGEPGDGRKGATVTTSLAVTPGETLTVFVGGEGEDGEHPDTSSSTSASREQRVRRVRSAARSLRTADAVRVGGVRREGGDGGWGYGEGGDGANGVLVRRALGAAAVVERGAARRHGARGRGRWRRRRR